VKLYVGYLRAKVEINRANPDLILNLRGIGYYYHKPS
jgi:DNA-binding response OmpR family regulator